MNKSRKPVRTRKQRAKGLIFTRCVTCNQTRAHTIAINQRTPMLRCQMCGTLRPVAQSAFPFDTGRR